MIATNVLDYTLKQIERAGDRRHKNIEDIPEYIDLCTWLTDLEFDDGFAQEWMSAKECFDICVRCTQYVFNCSESLAALWVKRIIERYYRKETKS